MDSSGQWAVCTAVDLGDGVVEPLFDIDDRSGNEVVAR